MSALLAYSRTPSAMKIDSHNLSFCCIDLSDQLKQELVRYFDRLGQYGIPNLKDLARIETKLCQHFGFHNFLSLSRAKKTFLEFLSIDHPEVRDTTFLYWQYQTTICVALLSSVQSMLPEVYYLLHARS